MARFIGMVIASVALGSVAWFAGHSVADRVAFVWHTASAWRVAGELGWIVLLPFVAVFVALGRSRDEARALAVELQRYKQEGAK